MATVAGGGGRGSRFRKVRFVDQSKRPSGGVDNGPVGPKLTGTSVNRTVGKAPKVKTSSQSIARAPSVNVKKAPTVNRTQSMARTPSVNVKAVPKSMPRSGPSVSVKAAPSPTQYDVSRMGFQPSTKPRK